jgi:hypothetical protein
MSSKRRHRNKPQAPAGKDAGASGEGEIFRPKDAPGVVIKREMVSEVGKGNKQHKRYRNVASTPLSLAYHREALTCDLENAWIKNPRANPCPAIMAKDRYDCGQKFERIWYERMGIGHGDSTIPRVSGGSMRSMTEVQEEAAQEIAQLRARMADRNYLIVEAMCGYGHSLVDALRHAGVQAHPVGTAYRIREALDDLVCAMTGRRIVPMLVPGRAVEKSRPGP